MAKETNEEARLRLFLAEYWRVCNRYSLYVYGNYDQEISVVERKFNGMDMLPDHVEGLKESGING
ncbi:hypothetical protein LCGC14_2633850 [marine sediment metagenome]|uniref:Uncharacterized protein n=1 Tax=marine sediment metagenome TaxID=412755 RepID=A0A0F8ZZB2_9ZZZZ